MRHIGPSSTIDTGARHNGRDSRSAFVKRPRLPLHRPRIHQRRHPFQPPACLQRLLQLRQRRQPLPRRAAPPNSSPADDTPHAKETRRSFRHRRRSSLSADIGCHSSPQRRGDHQGDPRLGAVPGARGSPGGARRRRIRHPCYVRDGSAAVPDGETGPQPGTDHRVRNRRGVPGRDRRDFDYGQWKRVVLRRHPASLLPRHHACLLLLLGLAASVALAGASRAAAAVPLAYLLALAAGSLAVAIRRQSCATLLLPVVLATCT